MGRFFVLKSRPEQSRYSTVLMTTLKLLKGRRAAGEESAIFLVPRRRLDPETCFQAPWVATASARKPL